jgi:epoxyqueuosine reductase
MAMADGSAMTSALTATSIKVHARELGFDLCGIAPAADHPELAFYREWLARGYAGEMAYLHRSAARRADVRNVVPSARAVIVTGTLYNTDRPYSTECADRSRAQIARYAWGDDYHEVIGERMEALLAWMREQSPEPFEARAYVDTGPVQERVYAQHAGIGWIGKNSCVINPEIGSWIFLAAIICSLPLDVDGPALDQCGTCTLCIEACPTHAIVTPGVLDSTRCLSYLTIELKGTIPEEHQHGIGSHVYGCDICQEVCPWNASAPRSADPAWQPRPAWDFVDLLTLARRTDDELTAALRGSPMKRTKAHGLRRNVAVALNNVQTTTEDRG